MYRYPTTHSNAEAFRYVANPPFPFFPRRRVGTLPYDAFLPHFTTFISSSDGVRMGTGGDEEGRRSDEMKKTDETNASEPISTLHATRERPEGGERTSETKGTTTTPGSSAGFARAHR